MDIDYKNRAPLPQLSQFQLLLSLNSPSRPYGTEDIPFFADWMFMGLGSLLANTASLLSQKDRMSVEELNDELAMLDPYLEEIRVASTILTELKREKQAAEKEELHE